MKPYFTLRSWLAKRSTSVLVLGVTAAFVLAAVSGCNGKLKLMQLQSQSGPITVSGVVMAGNRPIHGSAVQAYAAGTNVDGAASAARPLVPAPRDSDNSGAFTLSFSCPSYSTDIYLIASGGTSSNLVESNGAIALMADLGPCGDIVSSSPVIVNEVTTIGSIWPNEQNMSSETIPGITYTATTSMATNAAVDQLVSVSQGTSPGSGIPDGYAVQSSKIHTLADAMHNCVDSAGGEAGDGSPCGSLFSLTTLPGAAPPTNTLDAMLDIAKNLDANLTEIFDLASNSSAPPFVPALSAPPASWDLQLIEIPAAPEIVPASGNYAYGQQITIADSTTDAVIHYTIDGSEPTVNSPIFTNPLSLTASETIHAAAFTDETPSASSTASYSLTALPNPAISPAPGTYNSTVDVVLSESDSSAVICYTTDGSSPSASSPHYSGAIHLLNSATIRAIAIAGALSSGIASSSFTLAAPPPPSFSPAPGTYTAPANIQLGDSDHTAKIYYTTDGSPPSPSSMSYKGAIPVTVSTTIRAVAVDGGLSSMVGSASYAVSILPHLVFSAVPSAPVAGAPMALFSVTAEDANGNSLDTTNVPITVSLVTNDPFSALFGTTTENTVNGAAEFSGLIVNDPGSGYMLQAAAPGFSNGISSAFSVSNSAVGNAGSIPPNSVFNPPAENACQSPYDEFYESEPGVYAYWPLCEPGTNPSFYDYAGIFDLTKTAEAVVIPEFGYGIVTGGAEGPVDDGETAAQVQTAAYFAESQDIPVNKNAGALAVWVNTGAQSSSSPMISLSAISGSSAVAISTQKGDGGICFSGTYKTSAGTSATASKCGYTANAWHRVVSTWNSGSLSLYVDGQAAASTTYSGGLDDKIFYYRLFPGCCGNVRQQMTLAKAAISNQAWSAAQAAADYKPELTMPPTGGVYITADQLGTIHRDVLGYGDENSDLSTSALQSALKTGLGAAGVTSLRYASGTLGIQADLANWRGGVSCTKTRGVTAPPITAATNNNLDTYIPQIAKPLQLDLMYTVNYGTDPPLCDAGGDPVANGANLVNYANIVKKYGIKYWEIGNEQYSTGSETDFHPTPGDGASYAGYEKQFYTAMRAQDSSIKIGIPIGQGIYSWLTKWTYPAMANASYDAVIYHSYPVKDPVSDGNTLYQERVHSSLTRIRGSLLAVQTELLNFGKDPDAIWITEWSGNVSSGKWSRQSMGAVIPLFTTIQLAEYMRAGIPFANWLNQGTTNVCSPYNFDYTGFNTYSWWNCGSTALTYTGPVPSTGEIHVGMKAGDLMPAARAFQLLSESGFATEGEHMLRTLVDVKTSPWLLGYGATHGSSYALILINRDRDNTHTVPVQIAGMLSGKTVKQWVYGRAQYDQTASGNWSTAPQEGTTTGTWNGTFQATLPPWSVSVFVF